MNRLAVRLWGPACLAILRLAQRYGNERSIRRCNQIGSIREIGFQFEVANQGFISIGDGISISNRVLLSCYRGGSIKIGHNCFLGDNLIVASARAEISIGDDCLISEDVSIRAGNHGTKAGTLIRLQPTTLKNIQIGNDVWIGKGVSVIAGAIISDGCVIGPNSVVLGETEPGMIYVGSPIRKIMARAS